MTMLVILKVSLIDNCQQQSQMISHQYVDSVLELLPFRSVMFLSFYTIRQGLSNKVKDLLRGREHRYFLCNQTTCCRHQKQIKGVQDKAGIGGKRGRRHGAGNIPGD